MVDAPAAITFGSVAGEPSELKTPASPLATVTTTPASTAASLNCLKTSIAVTSGKGLPPSDSLRTSTWSTVTAYSIAWRILDVRVSSNDPKMSYPAMEAPGAIPSMRTRHAVGGDCGPKLRTL